MLIGKLSKITKSSRHTIRYYESLGLLEAPVRPNRFNNYKDYPDSNVERISIIRELQRLGFSLREIVLLIRHSKHSEFNCRSVSILLEEKKRAVEKEMKVLEERRKQIIATIHRIRKDPNRKTWA